VGNWFYTAPVNPAPDAAGPFANATTTPMLDGGSYLDYDRVDHIVYSSNMIGGFWRLIEP
jgi:hypothetical protein